MMSSTLLIGGNLPCMISFFFDAIIKSIKSFSNMESTSVAACLTDVEGDDTRLRIGKINKRSSLKIRAVANSAKANYKTAFC